MPLRTIPDHPITGWNAARSQLERCKNPARRDLLAHLARRSGVQSASGLDYVARLLRYHVDEADLPAPRRALTVQEIKFIEHRVLELLDPYVEDGDLRLAPRLHGFARRAA